MALIVVVGLIAGDCSVAGGGRRRRWQTGNSIGRDVPGEQEGSRWVNQRLRTEAVPGRRRWPREEWPDFSVRKFTSPQRDAKGNIGGGRGLFLRWALGVGFPKPASSAPTPGGFIHGWARETGGAILRTVLGPGPSSRCFVRGVSLVARSRRKGMVNHGHQRLPAFHSMAGCRS